ncbi:pyridoxamine 5'-phosphate oxidase family protein [Myceligenerans crystallogenes]|uniref:Pyridoxamine 5'-phosphate oxidase family protein n=1 Tax=Myceligenerans crystallogenes TaxID=316335 RepID=A0ABP4ZJQ3_9MICO
MDTHNISNLYDLPPLEWDAARTQLRDATAQGGGGPDRWTWWVTTVNADGSPHTNPVGALWHDDAVWFVTGPHTRRGHNLDRDTRVTAAFSAPELDLVVEGRAERVTDPAQVAALVKVYNDQGWPCTTDESGIGLDAPFMAASAGKAPWFLYRVAATSAHAVSTVEPGGATRWTF